MTYYSTEKVLEIIKMYHHNEQLLNERQEGYRSFGVAQLGIEASMPKANNISDVVANEAIKQIGSDMMYEEIRTDMKYLEDRWHRITREKDAQILCLKIQGYSSLDIGNSVECSKRNVDKRLWKIAAIIRGCSQI